MGEKYSVTHHHASTQKVSIITSTETNQTKKLVCKITPI